MHIRRTTRRGAGVQTRRRAVSGRFLSAAMERLASRRFGRTAATATTLIATVLAASLPARSQEDSGEPRAAAAGSKPADKPPEPQPQAAAWEPITVPQTDDAKALLKFIGEVQRRQPADRAQYLEMQTAINSAAQAAMRSTADRESRQYREAEQAFVGSAVMLMGNEGPDAQSKTMGKLIDYLKRTAEPGERDLRMLLLAGQNLEQLGRPEVAKEAYESAAETLESKELPRLAVWTEMLRANAKRLDSLGKVVELKGQTIAGEPFDLASLRGKFVLLYFWASWERSGEQEFEYMRRLYETYELRGFEIVAVSVDADRKQLEGFLERFDVPWVVLWDDSPDAAATYARLYGVNAIPTMILLDREGRAIHLEARGLVLGKLLGDQLPTPVE